MDTCTVLCGCGTVGGWVGLILSRNELLLVVGMCGAGAHGTKQ
jgi:hypothetical protein